MLIPDWIINLVLILITIRLLIWAFIFYNWLPVLYERDKGMKRFLKKIGRYIVGGLGFLLAAGIGNSLLKPAFMQSGNTVVKVEGQTYFSLSHSQQFFSPDFTFSDGSSMEIPSSIADEMVLLNNSPKSMILWESSIEGGKMEQKRLGIVAPYSLRRIPDEISCLVPGMGLSPCIAEESSTAYKSYHLSY